MSKIVVITGAASGVGKASAELFKTKGYTVVGIDRNSAAEISPVDDFVQVDLAKPNQIDSFVRDFSCKYGQLDVLVNNAGVHLFKSIAETSLDEYDFVQTVNCRAPFLLSKLCHPLLQKSKGSIVNVSSVHAVATTANRCAYAASKAALLSVTRSLAIEFGADKIRVNAVLPGAVHTEMMRDHVRKFEGGEDEAKIDGWIEDFEKNEMLGKMATPEDVAKAIFYLADGEQSGFMTGQSVTVDGGSLARYCLDVQA